MPGGLEIQRRTMQTSDGEIELVKGENKIFPWTLLNVPSWVALGKRVDMTLYAPLASLKVCICSTVSACFSVLGKAVSLGSPAS